MARENSNNDNAHTNERNEDNTPKALSRDDETKAETTGTVEKDTKLSRGNKDKEKKQHKNQHRNRCGN